MSHRDQRLTIAMIPFLSCSAKLPIYVPCIASLTAIRKTCGKWRYAVCTALFQTAVACGMGAIVYQAGRIVFGMP